MNKTTRYCLHFSLLTMIGFVLFLILGSMTKSFVKKMAGSSQQKPSSVNKIIPIAEKPIKPLKPLKQPIISDYESQTKVNEKDKRCNELITMSWTDKSEETLQAKAAACAHNNVN